MIFLPIGILIAYMIMDEILLRLYRKRIKLVIHVNGTRGKSTVVRMLDEAFRQNGYRTFSKVTGTVPTYRSVEGAIVPIKRVNVTVLEQRRMMKLAAKQGAEVVILECMALRPEMQELSERLIRADLAVITNLRTDHLEVMGLSKEEIADTLFGMTRREQEILVGDPALYDLKRDSYPKLSLAGRYPAVEEEQVENTNLVYAVADRFDLSDATAAIAAYPHDLAKSGMLDFRGNRVLAGFSVNDLESTLALYRQYKPEGKRVFWFHDRFDRPYRQEMFLKWMASEAPDCIILSGDAFYRNRRFLKKRGFIGRIVRLENYRETGQMIFGLGNMKNLEYVFEEGNHV